MKRTFAVLALIIPIIFQTALAQWTTDLSGDAPMAYVQRGDVLLAVTCFPSNKERIVMLRSNMVQDLLDGESMVSFSWNGSSENSDMATGRILDGFGERQLWLEDSGNLISKIRRYASVEIGFIKLVGASENRTLTLKGSTNAINSVYRACGYR